MSGYDNKITADAAIVITVNEPEYNEYTCVSCFTPFVIYKTSAYGAPVQTLFCTSCMTHLRNAIQREKENDYGF